MAPELTLTLSAPHFKTRSKSSIVLIPNSYATGMSHCTNAPFAFGCTNVLQPIYDKRTFASLSPKI